MNTLVQTKSPMVGPVAPSATNLSCLENSNVRLADQRRCGLTGDCKKKLALSDFGCSKCSTRFCSQHRLPENHKCPHDFKKEGQELLTKLNPRVVGEKLDRI
jgi:predicted nucleic acid binding AN1-type Zn finger protein